MTGCKQNNTQSSDVITVDVTKSYPKKELVLQDFMDVEYVVLETNREFVTQGSVLDISEEHIMVRNNNVDGDIFVYDRSGKALRKINRKGEGSEEYNYLSRFILDNYNHEMFVYESGKRKILVYDIHGNYKRTLALKENTSYRDILDYDKDNLICNVNITSSDDKEKEKVNSFYIISKQDGSIVKDIKMPYKEEKTSMLRYMDGNMSMIASFTYYPIIPYNGNFIITSISSDTILKYLPEHKMEPFIVRTPSIQSMSDPEVFLFPTILTDRYYFMATARKEFNIETQTGFPRKPLMFDRQEKAIYEFTVSNDDYADRTENLSIRTGNNEIAFYRPIQAFDLIEANKQGKLKGKLKEIADKLDEDSNPVIMLAKHKK